MLSQWFEALWTPKGRSNRARYWSVAAAALCMTLGLSGVAATAVVGPDGSRGAEMAVMLLVLPAFLAIFVAGLFNEVKRLHDLGWSGWWLALVYAVLLVFALLGAAAGEAGAPFSGLATLLNLAFVVTLGGMPGQPGPNRFGPPMNQPTEEVFS